MESSSPPRAPIHDQRVAVVHDWLTGMRGGEKVLEAILEIFPRADLFTLFHFPGSVSRAIESYPIRTSFLQRPAQLVGNYRRLLPLFPTAARQWDLSHYDLVISSSHCVAKGVRTGTRPHLSYCHTPMRYIWDRFEDYFPRERPLTRFAMKLLAPSLRRWDVATAAEVDRFVANSTMVAGRIRRFYDRESHIVNPFVDTRFLEAPIARERGPWHVIVSALVPYKRIEDAIAAARESGQRLKIIGDGPERSRLERLAGGDVELMGRLAFEEMVPLISSARSLIIPGIEDFGITALEAMALGTPVIAHREAGTVDAVIDQKTGLLFGGETSLAEAMRRVGALDWDSESLRAHAAGFSRSRFKTEIEENVAELIG